MLATINRTTKKRIQRPMTAIISATRITTLQSATSLNSILQPPTQARTISSILTSFPRMPLSPSRLSQSPTSPKYSFSLSLSMQPIERNSIYISTLMKVRESQTPIAISAQFLNRPRVQVKGKSSVSESIEWWTRITASFKSNYLRSSVN